jgi:hypothetical protein
VKTSLGWHAALLATLGAAGASACSKRSEAPPAEATIASAPRPIDQALPGELAEGSERAFGLPVPRRMRIEARFPDAIYAVGEISPELLANYVRERAAVARVETGPGKTVFNEAHLKTPEPGAPQRVVRIEVTVRGSVTELMVRDQTRAPAPDNVSEDERWKRHGLTPDGRPIDPTHLE